MSSTKQITSTTSPATTGKVPVSEIPTFAKDSRLDVREKPPLLDARPLPEIRDMDDVQFNDLSEQLRHEAFERAPETRGDRLFQQLFQEKDMLVRQQVRNAKEAVRLISGALTAFVDRKDDKAKIRQDDGPVINHARERVEMVTIVRSLRFVRGKYVVWVSIDEDDEDARCGVILRRRWRDPIHITGNAFPELLEKLAWHFSLAGRV